MNKGNRDSIYLEEAAVLRQEAFPGAQQLLRLHAPQVAARAEPGSFVHVQCDPLLSLRRPLSIMRVSAAQGWLDLLFKAVGQGTRLLAQRRPGDLISVLGPIGQVFRPSPTRPRTLLIGGGVGIPPMVFLAERLCERPDAFKPLVLMGSEVPFPFQPRPSQILVPGLPDGVIAAMPLLEDWGLPSRLASQAGLSGCFDGYVTELAGLWLEHLTRTERAQVEIFACGPHPMLAACARLARHYELPCQVSLEEFMACGVGGCAGCTVEVQGAEGPAMRRVCVDGPVFEARLVFPDALGP